MPTAKPERLAARILTEPRPDESSPTIAARQPEAGGSMPAARTAKTSATITERPAGEGGSVPAAQASQTSATTPNVRPAARTQFDRDATPVQRPELDRARGAPLAGPDGKPWWESYFGPDYPLLYPEKDRESGEREVRSILAALALRPGARVIDVGCGAGRHALAMARRGFKVTGIDRSPDRLSAAANARDAEGLKLDLHLADMRNLPLAGVEPAEALLSLFTSFGYFNEAENEQVARGMAASLASGGRLLLDLNNRELLQEANGARTWAERPGGYLLDQYGFDTDLRRFHGRRILLTEGRERSFVFDHRAYSEQEIRGLLKKAGLRVLAIYGSLERTPFNLRAPRMVVLAEKP